MESQSCQGRGGLTLWQGLHRGPHSASTGGVPGQVSPRNRQGTLSPALPQAVAGCPPLAEEQALPSKSAQARPVRFWYQVWHITTNLGLGSETSNAPQAEAARVTGMAFGVHVGAIPGHTSVERIDDRARGAGAGGPRMR